MLPDQPEAATRGGRHGAPYAQYGTRAWRAAGDAFLDPLVDRLRDPALASDELGDVVASLREVLPEAVLGPVVERVWQRLRQGSPHWRPEVEERSSVLLMLRTGARGTDPADQWTHDVATSTWCLAVVGQDGPTPGVVCPESRLVLALLSQYAQLDALALARLQELAQSDERIRGGLISSGRAGTETPASIRRYPVHQRRALASSSHDAQVLRVLAGIDDGDTVHTLLGRTDLPEDVRAALARRCGVPADGAAGAWPVRIPGADPVTKRGVQQLAALASWPALPDRVRREAMARYTGLLEELRVAAEAPDSLAQDRARYKGHVMDGLKALDRLLATTRSRADAEPRPGGAMAATQLDAMVVTLTQHLAPRPATATLPAHWTGRPTPVLAAHALAWITHRPEGASVEAIRAWVGEVAVLNHLAASDPSALQAWGLAHWSAVLTHPERAVRLRALALRGQSGASPEHAPAPVAAASPRRR